MIKTVTYLPFKIITGFTTVLNPLSDISLPILLKI